MYINDCVGIYYYGVGKKCVMGVIVCVGWVIIW